MSTIREDRALSYGVLMSSFRVSPPPKSLFGTIIWIFAGLCLFAWLYSKSAPHGEIAHELAAAGPDGVTAFFASPEEAVVKSNKMIAKKTWTQLARYYDFTYSSATPSQITSGTYFDGSLAVPPEQAIPRPFPSGYRFLYSEPTDLSGVIRVVVSGAPENSRDPNQGPQASFFMRSEPEGYRIIPADAAGRMKAAASDPVFQTSQSDP